METVRLSGKGTFVLPEVIRDLHKEGLLSLAYFLKLNGFTMFVVRKIFLTFKNTFTYTI